MRVVQFPKGCGHVESGASLVVRSIFVLAICSSGRVHAQVRQPRCCKALRAMARVYMACGELEKARPLAERALELAGKTAATDRELSACLIDLACLYKSQGEFANAEDMCRNGLALQAKVYGEDHPYIAYTLRILSEIYREQGRFEQGAATPGCLSSQFSETERYENGLQKRDET